jgi:hypothetical protein
MNTEIGRCRDCRHWVMLNEDGPNMCAAAELDWTQTLHHCVIARLRPTTDGTRIFEVDPNASELAGQSAALWTEANFGCVSFDQQTSEGEAE